MKHKIAVQSVGRRGAVIVLAAFLMTFLVGMVAFAVDIGWIALVKNQLQVAVDAAAHAGAAELSNGQSTSRAKAIAIAASNSAGGPTNPVELADSDVVFGNWTASTKAWTPDATPTNAVKVSKTITLSLFFGAVLGKPTQLVSATATATVNPRDIGFIVDLSGSMNNDTEIWATNAINSSFAGYPTIGSDLMQNVFADFGYGSYPGVVKHLGANPGQGIIPAPGGASAYIPAAQQNGNAYNYIANTFLLNNSNFSSTYRTLSGDSSATRKAKAYKYIMDYQLKQLMPNVKPPIDTASASSVSYWTDYIDYVVAPGSNPDPPNLQAYNMSGLSNPYGAAWPALTNSTIGPYYNKFGFQTYVQFMMDYGRQMKAGSQNVPLSTASAYCPYNVDTTPGSPGNGLWFPPREQPTHACRLAIQAAISLLKTQNAGISGALSDHVALITFDTNAGTTVRYPLSSNSMDYDACKASCCGMQAVGDNVSSTASETGFLNAKSHLDPSVNPNARPFANKIVVFLSDGIPNVKTSSNAVVDAYKINNSGLEWFTSGSNAYERNAALMQNNNLQSLGWKVYSVGIGLGCDRSLMDVLARNAGTAVQNPDDPTGPRISSFSSGNPADYQSLLTSIFTAIVNSKCVSIVQ